METTTTTAARKARRTAAPKQDRKSATRVKSTIVMDGSIDFRLGAIAAHLKLDRSALAAKLIDDGLRRYALDGVLRSFTDRQSEGAESSQLSLAGTSAA